VSASIGLADDEGLDLASLLDEADRASSERRRMDGTGSPPSDARVRSAR